jgi:uncharacterized protein with PIN domain
MARFYANENFPLQTVRALRRLGHDVVTSFEAGNANRSVPDEEVLTFAAGEQRILLTQNRLHFLRLHQHGVIAHAGIVVCTYDPNFERLAQRIHEQVSNVNEVVGKLLRVYRPG